MSHQYGGPQQGGPIPPQNPYGAANPYPGMPQPGAPAWGAPGYPAPPGYYAPPPRRRKKWPWIVGGVVVCFVALAVIGYFTTRDDAANAKKDDCITGAKQPKIVSCGAENAAFRVVEKFDDTGDTNKCDTPALQEQGRVAALEFTGRDKQVLCLTITKHTKPSDFDQYKGLNPDQAGLDRMRDQLDLLGVRDVK
ncbi:LppU/SCO3897 family protein [Uniformispora flossi]|uniref:LppU/SCO3897 family protein n=1 Tax=Uniformispora flossi TaxID=3390723 RepID=UPI003C2D88FC